MNFALALVILMGSTAFAQVRGDIHDSADYYGARGSNSSKIREACEQTLLEQKSRLTTVEAAVQAPVNSLTAEASVERRCQVQGPHGFCQSWYFQCRIDLSSSIPSLGFVEDDTEKRLGAGRDAECESDRKELEKDSTVVMDETYSYLTFQGIACRTRYIQVARR